MSSYSEDLVVVKKSDLDIHHLRYFSFLGNPNNSIPGLFTGVRQGYV
jgi:hypothetical protein